MVEGVQQGPVLVGTFFTLCKCTLPFALFRAFESFSNLEIQQWAV